MRVITFHSAISNEHVTKSLSFKPGSLKCWEFSDFSNPCMNGGRKPDFGQLSGLGDQCAVLKITKTSVGEKIQTLKKATQYSCIEVSFKYTLVICE